MASRRRRLSTAIARPPTLTVVPHSFDTLGIAAGLPHPEENCGNTSRGGQPSQECQNIAKQPALQRHRVVQHQHVRMFVIKAHRSARRPAVGAGTEVHG